MIHSAAILALLLACAAPLCVATPAANRTNCWALRKDGRPAQAEACFEALTRSSSAYERAEGFWGLEDWQQANEQFRLAAQDAGASPMVKVRWGMLLHERFNDPDAAALFHEAIEKDPSLAEAYVGLALVSAEGFDGRAAEYAAHAIALDPKLAEAHELMAELALTNDDHTAAAAEADKAMALESDALDAMAIHAALELIADRSPNEWFAKIRAVNPGYGEA
jgi:cellulose synthase operon protein C